MTGSTTGKGPAAVLSPILPLCQASGTPQWLFTLALDACRIEWSHQPSVTFLLLEVRAASQSDSSPSLSALCPNLLFYFLLFIYLFILLFRATPMAHEGSQVRSLIGATAAGLHQSHSNTRSEPRLQPTPQLTATPDLSHVCNPHHSSQQHQI